MVPQIETETAYNIETSPLCNERLEQESQFQQHSVMEIQPEHVQDPQTECIDLETPRSWADSNRTRTSIEHGSSVDFNTLMSPPGRCGHLAVIPDPSEVKTRSSKKVIDDDDDVKASPLMQSNPFSPVPGSPPLCCSSTSHQNITTNQMSKPFSAPNLNKSADCNPAKGGIYITKEDIHQMMKLCDSEFTTDIEEDQRCLFGYYKESKSMQIIGGQVGPHTVRTVTDSKTQRQCQIL